VDDLETHRDGLQPRSGRGPATLQTCLSHAYDVLDKAGIEGYDVEARLLCEWAIGCTKLDFMVRPNELVSDEQVTIIQNALQKRLAGMPVHRIMGYREFYGLKLYLSPQTLEPRPDTETLVDQVIDLIKKKNQAESPLRILDLGTGTGAIALALLSKFPKAHVFAVDVSDQAIETARENAEENDLSARFTALQSDWFENVTGQFDIIVSNPPYIRTEIIGELEIEVREHDPFVALDGGPDGLGPYRIIASNVARYLHSDGLVCLEVGYDQASDIKELFSLFGFGMVELRKDLGNRDRALAFTMQIP
jgi:release factor glutamine methyltransferase